eukprot:CAMPEP_0183343268 /NCGR_PEP_ID=MMETSP0164_2-20130417/9216_1 /TAXON_ID=221442 /ORGANISM="Coccolithus pelagicus ssp braarudi, Strain PLY182g" /LENGTH=446 /DNA_ID=CAMNT_0025514047 /DNA_START=14 /DNA_END=1354 /DNA_ORIENTATION=-
MTYSPDLERVQREEMGMESGPPSAPSALPPTNTTANEAVRASPASTAATAVLSSPSDSITASQVGPTTAASSPAHPAPSWIAASLKAASAELGNLAERHQLRERASDLASDLAASLQKTASTATVRLQEAAATASSKLHEAADLVGAGLQQSEAAPPTLEIKEWAALLGACEPYAKMRGWRFDLQDLLDMDAESGQEARAKALPMALAYADRLAASPDSEAAMRHEFRLCQKLVASDAVYNTAVTTCRALGLWAEDRVPAAMEEAEGGSARTDEMTPLDEQANEASLLPHLPQALLFALDFSEPLPKIARMLQAIESRLRESGADRSRSELLYRASFVVEFGLAHGLPAWHDEPSGAKLRQFLERLKEWKGHDAESRALVQALVLDTLDARPSLRESAIGWFDSHAEWIGANKLAVAAGGALFGVVGLVAAGAAIAAAGGRAMRRA